MDISTIKIFPEPPELAPAPIWIEVACGMGMLRRFCCSHCGFEIIGFPFSKECPNCGLIEKGVLQNGRFN